ncbi:DUF3349 domain-containing protein [Tomitella gaofuii]|uniref:DUF3349 domain-containing protein n=1 Tax=Tomitella gaofuii TaxID=2760083 RepID=UPI0015FE25A3|nr:DUF3349 domain-containing protein [Tomitella gaofuii]
MHPLIAAVTGWLRAGYPDGVPPKDYFPLLAVLQRKLTDEEIREVVDALIEDVETPIEVSEIEDTIVRLTSESPLEDDVKRVAVRLAAGGWPLADPESIDDTPEWLRNTGAAQDAEPAQAPAPAEGPRPAEEPVPAQEEGA